MSTRTDADLVVFKEGDYTFTYDLRKTGGWRRVCLAVVLRRLGQGYTYYDPEDEYPDGEPQPPPMPEQIRNAREAKTLATDWEQYEYRLRNYRDLAATWKLVQKVKAGGSGALFAATRLIEGGKGYEFESYAEAKYEGSDGVPRWVLSHQERADLAGAIVARLLTDPFNEDPSIREWAQVQCERLLETTTEPPPENYGDGDEHTADLLRSSVRELLAVEPDEPRIMPLQDTARARMVKYGKDIEFDPFVMTTKRLERYGTAEAIAAALVDAEYPPGSARRKRWVDEDRLRWKAGDVARRLAEERGVRPGYVEVRKDKALMEDAIAELRATTPDETLAEWAAEGYAAKYEHRLEQVQTWAAGKVGR